MKQFIRIIKCHCPSTGRIGNIKFENVPCLLSKGKNKLRKTPYTVEAISLNSPKAKRKQWIGINQNAANRYIEFFLKSNQFKKMLKKAEVSREVKLGNSRIDFKIGDTYVEVKTPLINLPSSKHIGKKKESKFNSFDRLIKHFDELGKTDKAILLLCYIYDAEPFKPPKLSKDNVKIVKSAKRAEKKGVENWQVNLKINKKGVELLDYFKLNLF